ncbi:HAD-like domain-containing protein [Copromyces sp. CBS 386.78]|nr:HAD-like domain-containing protein [Copromyces sp. CBS 386.78]
MPFWKTAHQSITRNITQRMARLIVFDFDGTVTQQDTINILAQCPIYSTSLTRPRNEARNKWKNIVDLYVADHAKHKELYVPKVEDRKTLAEELAYLESLRTVEVASVERVVNAKFFAGLTRERWVELGRKAREYGEDPDWEGGEGNIVTMRKGFSEFVRQARARGDKLGIVSVNWSQAFVEGVIEAEDGGQGHKGFVKRVNEIKYPDGELEGPEEMGGKVMMTARDKLEGFETMLLDETDADGGRSVYFGDSVTDLECLLRADTGIVVVNEGEEEKSKLLGTLQRLGFEVLHVSEAREGAKLAWARDFEEVLGSKILG